MSMYGPSEYSSGPRYPTKTNAVSKGRLGGNRVVGGPFGLGSIANPTPIDANTATTTALILKRRARASISRIARSYRRCLVIFVLSTDRLSRIESSAGPEVGG